MAFMESCFFSRFVNSYLQTGYVIIEAPFCNPLFVEGSNDLGLFLSIRLHQHIFYLIAVEKTVVVWRLIKDSLLHYFGNLGKMLP